MRRERGWWCALGAVVVILTLAGCTTTRPYTDARADFPGIKDLLDGSPERGIEPKHVSLLFIHGMGSFSKPKQGGPDDPIPAIRFMAEELGLDVGKGKALKLEHEWRGCVSRWPLTNRDGEVVLHTYALHWKPTTDPILTSLKEADSVDPLEDMRPEGTRKLKDDMTDRLGDVALYAGEFKDTIQDTVIEGLEAVVNDETNVHDDDHAIVPITWSLGSRVLFDTLERISTSKKAEMRALASRIPLVFMLANQIQFLELADQPYHPADATEKPKRQEVGFDTPLRTFSKARAASRTWLVGITDPSDLLSWPLPPAPEGSHLELVNAYHSTATSALWLPGVGKIGNPLSAHTDYGADTQVLRWLLYGKQGASYCQPGSKPGY